MGKKLVIVESPHKAKTIWGILKKSSPDITYDVQASKGHITEIADSGKGNLGIDIDNGFKVDYELIKGKDKTVEFLKNKANEVDEVYLATDPDREGEAIAYHLADNLGLDINTTKRLEFHEITPRAINGALKNPRYIDMNLVHSQDARKVLDKIVGYKLSKLVQRKFSGKSAGRVQSVVLSLIVKREQEIREFINVITYSIQAKIDADGKELIADLVDSENKIVTYKSKEEAQEVISKLATYLSLLEITKEDTKRRSFPVHNTSTLAQEANRLFNMSLSQIAKTAQSLYDQGYITYHRTDSTTVAPEFIAATKKYINNTYGEDYVGYPKGKAGAQDGHEGIRPTDITLSKLPKAKKEEENLYKLIYKRALQSLLADAKIEVSTAIFSDGQYRFLTKGSRLIFPGFLVLENTKDEYIPLPPLEINKKYLTTEYLPLEHETKPPLRYTEATIVKKMEEVGIGRPSTYSQAVITQTSRNYVTIEKKYLIPTEKGEIVANALTDFFPKIIDVDYTKKMELQLDDIANPNSNVSELQVLNDFYADFKEEYDNAKANMDKNIVYTNISANEQELIDTPVGRDCPECGKPLKYIAGKYGLFIACSNYPKCKYHENISPNNQTTEIKFVGENCPECGSPLVEKYSPKSKKTFIGCSNYPKCTYIKGRGEAKTTDKKPYSKFKNYKKYGYNKKSKWSIYFVS